MNALTVADVLDAAPAFIERNGWCQWNFYRYVPGKKYAECEVCTMGAINMAIWGVPEPRLSEKFGVPGGQALRDLTTAAYEAVENYLQLDWSVGRWNDEPGRTVEEVLAALEGAARAERERAA